VQEFIADSTAGTGSEVHPHIIGVLKLILGKAAGGWNWSFQKFSQKDTVTHQDEMRKIINSSRGSGALYSQRWPEQVFAVAKYSGCTSRPRPASCQIFVDAVFGTDRSHG